MLKFIVLCYVWQAFSLIAPLLYRCCMVVAVFIIWPHAASWQHMAQAAVFLLRFFCPDTCSFLCLHAWIWGYHVVQCILGFMPAVDLCCLVLTVSGLVDFHAAPILLLSARLLFLLLEYTANWVKVQAMWYHVQTILLCFGLRFLGESARFHDVVLALVWALC